LKLFQELAESTSPPADVHVLFYIFKKVVENFNSNHNDLTYDTSNGKLVVEPISIIDENFEIKTVATLDDRESKNEKDENFDNYYHFLNFASKSLIHLLVHVYFDVYPSIESLMEHKASEEKKEHGVLSSHSPYFVHFRGKKSRMSELQFLVEKISSAHSSLLSNGCNEEKYGQLSKEICKRSIARFCSVSTEKFIQLQDDRLKRQLLKKSERRMRKNQEEKEGKIISLINVDGIMKNGTGMIELTCDQLGNIIGSIEIFSQPSWYDDFYGSSLDAVKKITANVVENSRKRKRREQPTSQWKCRVESFLIDDFLRAFYTCHSTKFLTSWMPTKFRKIYFNQKSLQISREINGENYPPFLYKVEKKEEKKEVKEEKIIEGKKLIEKIIEEKIIEEKEEIIEEKTKEKNDRKDSNFYFYFFIATFILPLLLSNF
jgi:hypothetical protein